MEEKYWERKIKGSREHSEMGRLYHSEDAAKPIKEVWFIWTKEGAFVVKL